ncbi:hypothetical protein [Ferrovibrio sp.]|uniref:hypothetical protein n=1 Tax=Ferrovibrio sp. TaxID=1917215 RepID=UPI00311DA055
MQKFFRDDQLRRHDIDTLKKFLRRRLGGYVVALRYVQKDNWLYRAVRWKTPPPEVSMVSYPPAGIVRELGRLNRIGEPMFYCSRGQDPTLYEVNAKIGETFAISEWEMKEPLWMHNLGYHPVALGKLGPHGSEEYRPFMRGIIPNEASRNEKIRRRMALDFTEVVSERDNYRYKQSIAINELLFDNAESIPSHPDGPTIDEAVGTVYPSIKNRGAADNVAIRPKFVDSSLKLRTISFIRIEEVNPESDGYTYLQTHLAARFDGNKICWEELTSAAELRRRYIYRAGNHYILRDGLGNLIARH